MVTKYHIHICQPNQEDLLTPKSILSFLNRTLIVFSKSLPLCYDIKERLVEAFPDIGADKVKLNKVLKFHVNSKYYLLNIASYKHRFCLDLDVCGKITDRERQWAVSKVNKRLNIKKEEETKISNKLRAYHLFLIRKCGKDVNAEDTLNISYNMIKGLAEQYPVFRMNEPVSKVMEEELVTIAGLTHIQAFWVLLIYKNTPEYYTSVRISFFHYNIEHRPFEKILPEDKRAAEHKIKQYTSFAENDV